MRRFRATCVILLALAGPARADQLVETNLDVAIPAAWTASSLYTEAAGGVDELIYAGADGEVGPTVLVSRAELGEGLSVRDDCSGRMEALAASDAANKLHGAVPSWVPASFVPWAVRSPLGTSEMTSICTAGPDGYVLLVSVILMTASSKYDTATPMLEAIALATEWGRVEVAAPEAEEVPIYAPEVEPDDEAEVLPEPAPPAEAPPLASVPVRSRPLRVGVGPAYLDPRTRDAGYGLAVSLGYHLGFGSARLHGELRGIAGVDSKAGLWAEGRGLLVTRVGSRYGVTLAGLLGGGFDGIGKPNNEMNLTMGFAPSFQVGGRATRHVDDGGYELEGTGAIRATDQGGPTNALRFGLARLWTGRRLAAVSVGYVRYSHLIDQVTAMVTFRL